jgi:hypothetical protein
MSKGRRRSVERTRSTPSRQPPGRVEEAPRAHPLPVPTIAGDATLATDVTSPHAVVEDRFFKDGISVENAPAGSHAAEVWAAPLPHFGGRGQRAAWIVGAIGVAALAVVVVWKSSGKTQMTEPPPARPAQSAPRLPPPEPIVAAPPPAATPAIAPTPVPTAPTPVPTAPVATLKPAILQSRARSVAKVTAVTAAAGGNTDLDKRCRTAHARGRSREVVDNCKRAFVAKPTAADIAVMLAQAEFDLSRMGPAMTWAQKAIALNPRAADAYVFLGGVHQEAGRRREARAAYKRYLELAPQGRYAAELKTVIQSL